MSKSIKVKISGMHCASCAMLIEKSLQKIDGISEALVNYGTESASLVYDENIVNTKTIDLVIEKLGYHVVSSSENVEKIKNKESHDLFVRLIVSLIFTVPLFYISMAPMLPVIKLPYPKILSHTNEPVIYSVVSLILCLPVMIFGYKFYISGIKAFLQKSPNMDSLVTLGVFASFVYSIYSMILMFLGYDIVVHEGLYFESAAVIITLVTLGKFLEGKSKSKTNQAIQKLIKLQPKTAIVLRDGVEMNISIDDVVVSDIVVVRPG